MRLCLKKYKIMIPWVADVVDLDLKRLNMFSENILLIFVKYPLVGFVKTRLGKSIGYKQAALLYKLLAEATLKQANSSKFKTIVFYYPPCKKYSFRKWLGKDILLFKQQGDNLGQRLSNAFKIAFKNGAKKVIVIGTDSPLLGKKDIIAAFNRLDDNDCVIGPAHDGGYYLLGLRREYPQVFEAINWGTDTVFSKTLRNIHNRSLGVYVLNKHFDVDNMDDLVLLNRRLRRISKGKKHSIHQLQKAVEKFL